MQISKEARSAACEAFDQSYFHDAKDSDERLYIALMAGIEAALAAAPAGAVPVAWEYDLGICREIAPGKPYEWEARIDRKHPRKIWPKAELRNIRPLFAAPPPQATDGWHPTHQHKKRGTEYEHLGAAHIQSDVPLTDMDAVEVYRGHDGALWARRQAEFHDGRFEVLPAAPPPKAEGGK